MEKITKLRIEDYLGTIYYNNSGYRKLNGGFANAKIKTWKKKGDLIKVNGYMISGVDDCGDGHAEKYTDEIDVILKITDKGLQFADKDTKFDEDD